jgi:hypothetical protein
MLYLPTKADLVSWEEAREEHASKVLYEAGVIAEQSGISAELLHVPDEHPATAIIETAKSRGCDLIVMALVGNAASGNYSWGVKHRRFLPTEACRCWWCLHQRTNDSETPAGESNPDGLVDNRRHPK